MSKLPREFPDVAKKNRPKPPPGPPKKECGHIYIEAVADAIGDGYIRCHNCKEVLQPDIRKGYKGLSVEFNGTGFTVTTKEV